MDIDQKNETISKSNVIRLLKAGIIGVKFTKADGTERTMKCTLLEGYIKPYERKTEDKERVVNDDIISVWDIEKDAWRAFRYDSLLEVHAVRDFNI